MRYVSQVDYGVREGVDHNEKNPRWAVFRTYFIWAGNHGTTRESPYMWTMEEAVRFKQRLDDEDAQKKRTVLIAATIAVVVFVAIAVRYI